MTNITDSLLSRLQNDTYAISLVVRMPFSLILLCINSLIICAITRSPVLKKKKNAYLVLGHISANTATELISVISIAFLSCRLTPVSRLGCYLFHSPVFLSIVFMLFIEMALCCGQIYATFHPISYMVMRNRTYIGSIYITALCITLSMFATLLAFIDYENSAITVCTVHEALLPVSQLIFIGYVSFSVMISVIIVIVGWILVRLTLTMQPNTYATARDSYLSRSLILCSQILFNTVPIVGRVLFLDYFLNFNYKYALRLILISEGMLAAASAVFDFLVLWCLSDFYQDAIRGVFNGYQPVPIITNVRRHGSALHEQNNNIPQDDSNVC